MDWYFKSFPIDLVVYNDADWASPLNDRKFSNAFYSFLGGNLISWQSSKKCVVSWSSTKSKYREIALATIELMWLQFLFLNFVFHCLHHMSCFMTMWVKSLIQNPICMLEPSISNSINILFVIKSLKAPFPFNMCPLITR